MAAIWHGNGYRVTIALKARIDRAYVTVMTAGFVEASVAYGGEYTCSVEAFINSAKIAIVTILVICAVTACFMDDFTPVVIGAVEMSTFQGHFWITITAVVAAVIVEIPLARMILTPPEFPVRKSVVAVHVMNTVINISPVNTLALV